MKVLFDTNVLLDALLVRVPFADQVSAAMEARLDAIVTRDVSGFIGSPILVMSPEELVKQLGQ